MFPRAMKGLAPSLIIVITLIFIMLLAHWLKSAFAIGKIVQISSYNVSSTLIEEVFVSEAFEAKIIYPKKAKPWKEIHVKVYVKAKGEYLLSAVALKALSRPVPGFIMWWWKAFYENVTKFTTPVKEFSATYTFRPPELSKGLNVELHITPTKPKEPLFIFFARPITVSIDIVGAEED